MVPVIFRIYCVFGFNPTPHKQILQPFSSMDHPLRRLAGFARRATTVADRWLVTGSGLTLIWLMGATLAPPGSNVQIFRDNRLVLTLPLTHPRQQQVEGRLGPVEIQVEPGRARLLEHASPRMIGTRTGWVSHAGASAACVPCGIVLQVTGNAAPPDALDAMSR